MISSVRQHGRTVGRSLRCGFTLIELVVTIAVMAVIMLGVGSAMLIVSHAVPTADNPAAATIAVGQVAETIAGELQYAVSIVDSNATMIEFTVADRDGNDVPETIRYAWSGTPGGPLTRQYNSGTALTVLADVNQFDLSYNLKTVTTETLFTNESGETSLSSYDDNTDLADLSIKNNQSYGQYFLPSLPGDAVSWRITRAQFKAKGQPPTTGESRVQLRLAEAGGLPGALVLEEKILLESTLTTDYTLQEYLFENVVELAPDQGVCLIVKWIAKPTACKIQGDTNASSLPDGHLVKGTAGGTSWSVQNGESLLYWVYGTVTTVGASQVETAHYLGGVNLILQAGDDAAQANVQAGVRVLNEPEVTP